MILPLKTISQCPNSPYLSLVTPCVRFERLSTGVGPTSGHLSHSMPGRTYPFATCRDCPGCLSQKFCSNHCEHCQASARRAPFFFLDNALLTQEFWHAHLNYACRQANLAHKGPVAGNQLCNWNSAPSDSSLQVTHLVVFLPPAVGACVLQPVSGPLHLVSDSPTVPTVTVKGSD